jgi:isopenicillin N synthase-like dioxygenase
MSNIDVPVIDVSPLVTGHGDERAVAAEIDAACREMGFFAIVGHGVDASLCQRLDALAREFFARPDDEKAAIAMPKGGRAWRGWFPVGGELTSGIPDRKEGIYFGDELPSDDPRVGSGRPLHGANLFPDRPAELKPTVLAYLDALTAVSQHVMRGVALGLGLDREWFSRDLTADPVILFRIFNYPPATEAEHAAAWGVGEHTDYGLLTVLLQDDTGGLQVRAPSGWIDVPPIEDAFVCNVGDMLERMTGGVYRSTPHRARNPGTRGRLSFPFFFDPGWDTEVKPLPVLRDDAVRPAPPRWDRADVFAFEGTYGEYLVEKVSKVFPALHDDVL